MPGVITALEHAKSGCVLVGGVTLNAASFVGLEMNRERPAAALGEVAPARVGSEVRILNRSTVSPLRRIYVTRD